jgi:hypothetical protein
VSEPGVVGSPSAEGPPSSTSSKFKNPSSVSSGKVNTSRDSKLLITKLAMYHEENGFAQWRDSREQVQLHNCDMLVDTIKSACAHPDSHFIFPDNAKQFKDQLAVNIHYLGTGEPVILRNHREVPDRFTEKIAEGSYVQDYYHGTTADSLWGG